MKIHEVFGRWIRAELLGQTAEEISKLHNSPDFYPVNNYNFDGCPKLVDGEVGYDDLRQKRIVLHEP